MPFRFSESRKPRSIWVTGWKTFNVVLIHKIEVIRCGEFNQSVSVGQRFVSSIKGRS